MNFHPSMGLLLLGTLLLVPHDSSAAPVSRPESLTAGDRMLDAYLEREVSTLAGRCLAEVKSAADWERWQPVYRRQLREMLGLDPWPARSDLRAQVTGVVEREDFVVEKLHFQSMPGLYVTANLYRPKTLAGPAPTILYLSGHGPVISNGVSYGNKVAYQRHGIWFARNGYICLVLDTLQLGELQGLHHGTYREGMWWWNARGYSPAGVEAWNAVRALDYLETRPEVDQQRFGATGRSGGGAYSWWIAALDERIRAAARVAGMTDLRNHVVDGVVEGHCDCMFTVNTYRWDYPQVAALVAPRPLLIVNTDADSIFPLDGVGRTHTQVRRIYGLLGADGQLGLVIGPGPHKDTQDLQMPVFRWFNRHLKGDEPLIELAAKKEFTPQELKVFATLPTDAVNAHVEEIFVPPVEPARVPETREAWERQRDSWRAGLAEKVFAGWPGEAGPLQLERKFSSVRAGVRLEAWDFASDPATRLRLYVARDERPGQPRKAVLEILGDTPSEAMTGGAFLQWRECWRTLFAAELAEELALGGSGNAPPEVGLAEVRRKLAEEGTALAWVAPRGLGLSVWSGDAKKAVQIRRRFMLLGQTVDSQRVWDVRRAVAALGSLAELRGATVTLRAEGNLGCDAVYAAIYEPGVASLELRRLPASHRTGPDYLNVLRVLDIPQALALAAERVSIRLWTAQGEDWTFPQRVAAQLGWGADRVRIESVAAR